MPQVAATTVRGLVQHFESVLGPVRSGWMSAPTGEQLPYQVVRYATGPDTGSVAYSSLGLSRHALLAADGTTVRQEVLVLATKSLPVEYVLGMVQTITEAMLTSGRPLCQGEVLGAGPAGLNDSAMVEVYVALPVYFDDSFATFVSAEGMNVEVMWLVPVTAAEAQFVRVHGWERFEDLLLAEDPDLVDVHRAPVVL